MLFAQGSPLMKEPDLIQVYLISKNIYSLGELISNEEQRVSL